MRHFEWISTKIPRRVVAVRMRTVDELKLPEIDAPFGVLVIAFDPGARCAAVEKLGEAIGEAGTFCLPDVGGPGAEAWWGPDWHSDMDWSRSPKQAIELYFHSSITGLGVSVTTFVVLCLDGDDAGWREVLEVTRAALSAAEVDQRLHAAAAAGREAEVRHAIADGWPIEDFDVLAEAPLHAAGREGHLGIMRMLLAAGADVNLNCEDRIGETPLGEVAGTCSLEVARLLIDAGADPTIPGWMGLTALRRAAERTDEAGKAVFELLKTYEPRSRG